MVGLSRPCPFYGRHIRVICGASYPRIGAWYLAFQDGSGHGPLSEGSAWGEAWANMMRRYVTLVYIGTQENPRRSAVFVVFIDGQSLARVA